MSLAACVAIAGCGGGAEQTDYGGVVQFDTATIRILTPHDSIPLRVEIASSAEQRTMGLMERRVLPESAGMIFLYPSDQPATAGFWMFRTRIPLDIAFLDSAGAVVAIRTMPSCSAELAAGCPSYSPDVPYRAALEVNAGYFQRHGVSLGSVVTLPTVRAQ
jgi:uncharacterized membrane protein (UPF0127 family)